MPKFIHKYEIKGPKMSLTYVIADMHGRYDLFVKALQFIEEDSPIGGTLIILGDFIDRGPQSRQIIETLIKGPSSDRWQWIVIQGNHEDIMIQAIVDFRKLDWWIKNGGGETLISYGYQEGDLLLPFKIPEEHIWWLASLPLYHQDEHRIYVHAGVPPRKSVEKTSKYILQWMFYSQYETSGNIKKFADKPHLSGKHIVHGHHQSDKHPLLLPHRTNLDAGAFYTNRLAIGVFEDKPGGPVKIIEAKNETSHEVLYVT